MKRIFVDDELQQLAEGWVSDLLRNAEIESAVTKMIEDFERVTGPVRKHLKFEMHAEAELFQVSYNKRSLIEALDALIESMAQERAAEGR